MRTMLPKSTARGTRGTALALLLCLLWVFTPGRALAAFCSAASCSLTLTDSNFAGAGKFGTVNLTLSPANVVTIDVKLANPYRIVKTGFPGAIGFAENGGSRLTIGNFETGGASTSLYSGSLSSTPGCTTNDCHWAEFGYANNAAATSGPQRPVSLQQLSFTVSSENSITDVHQLLRQFDHANGGKGPAYFVVDACAWDLKKSRCGDSGLFAATQIPEPATLALLMAGLSIFALLGLLRWNH